jgi:hypothetical protein
MNLSLRQKSILVGTILGDGYLQKTGAKNARLRLEHGFKQKEYLLWKSKELGNLFQGKLVYLKRIHPLSRKTYRYFRHQSQASPILGKLRNIFYPAGRKAIPDNIEKFLYSPLVLAVWYMDDGYYYPRDKCAYIYLGRIIQEDAKKINEAVKKKFHLETKILNKKNKGFVLYFSPEEVIKLKKLISEHILDYFNYKLPL